MENSNIHKERGGPFIGLIRVHAFELAALCRKPLVMSFSSLVLCIGMVSTQASAQVSSVGNNFTMASAGAAPGVITGGTNDVDFTWDGTQKTSVAVSGQSSNATITSTCPFFSFTWSAHDVTVYGPGTYTIYSACPAGSPGCGDTADPSGLNCFQKVEGQCPPVTFTVGPNELGGHMLFDWNVSTNIDVVDIWTHDAVYAPSPMCGENCTDGPPCGSNLESTVWHLMAKDGDGDGTNGIPMPDGPFVGQNANFNVMVAPCNKVCNDNSPCTEDSCNTTTGACVYTAAGTASCNTNICLSGMTCSSGVCQGGTPNTASCSDNDICTGTVASPDVCSGGSCQSGAAVICGGPYGCDPAYGCPPLCPPGGCDDNNVCTDDACDAATGACINTNNTLPCDDINICTENDACSGGSCSGTPVTCSSVNNFSMIDGTGALVGGTNDVLVTWTGPIKYAVAASGQISNAQLSSTCPFFGNTWTTHDVAIYGPGTYTIYDGCPAGSPGCGSGNAITFTVDENELGGHILFTWHFMDSNVVNVWQRNTVFGPSQMWIGSCGANAANKVWDLMSSDFEGDGKNGYPSTAGQFKGFSFNFNLMSMPCNDVCDDNNPCTDDACNTANGTCIFSSNSLLCDDGLLCTENDICSSGSCSGTPVTCSAGGACDPATGCDLCNDAATHCDDNDVCTTDGCVTSTGECQHTAIAGCGADNTPPTTPILMFPGDKAMGLGTTVEFKWKKSTDPDGDTVTYHFYNCADDATANCTPVTVASHDSKGLFYAGSAGLFLVGMTFIGGLTGRRSAMLILFVIVVLFAGGALISCGGSETADEMSHTVTGLSVDTTYYWKVVADDQKANGTTSATVWSYTTE